MTRITATNAKNTFARIIEDAAHGDRIEITSHGRSRAVLISPEDFARLQALEDAEDLAYVRAHADEPTVSIEEARIQFGL